MSFSGSSLWDLFSSEADSLVNTYSLSVKIMCNIPRETHRYLIEPISERPHLKFILIKRFLGFKNQVNKCPKSIIKKFFKLCQNDTQSITGSNFRKIMLLCKKTSIDHIVDTDIDNLSFCEIPENEEWRLNLVKDLIEARNDPEVLPGFSYAEITDMLEFTCVS